MTIKKELQEDMKNALRNKERDKLAIIRVVLSDIQNLEISERGEVTEQQLIGVIQKNISQTKESLEAFENVGTNQQEIDKNKLWLEILAGYLPEQLSVDQVKDIISGIISEGNYSGKKDIRHVMPKAMKEVKGKFDGKEVNKLVLDLLGRS